MQSIEKFKIDEWIRHYAPKCEFQLYGSCVSPVSANDLQSLSSAEGGGPINLDLKLAYGESEGSFRLRRRIAELHSTDEKTLTADNVVITPGSIMANYLVLATICGPGDHVICQYPTYGQLYLLPKNSGVELSLWAMREKDNWIPDVEELVRLIRPNTKAIILNNPSNPTGTVLSRSMLEKIVGVAQQSSLTLFADEVFSPLFHTDEASPPPLVALGYKHSVSTGSVSKAHGLPGIRVGWVVTQNAELMEKIVTARDYTTLNVSQLDDGVAAYALSKEVLPNLLRRNLALCQKGIAMVEEFVDRTAPHTRWIRPAGAGVAFVQLLDKNARPLDEAAFSARLADEEGVAVTPGGHCFQDEGTDDFKGYIRIAIGEPGNLRGALRIVEGLLAKYVQAD